MMIMLLRDPSGGTLGVMLKSLHVNVKFSINSCKWASMGQLHAVEFYTPSPSQNSSVLSECYTLEFYIISINLRKGSHHLQNVSFPCSG